MEVFTNNWNSRKYQIGYALSGGFIKGFAHLGVMQALLEHDIKPQVSFTRTATSRTKYLIISPDINSRI